MSDEETDGDSAAKQSEASMRSVLRNIVAGTVALAAMGSLALAQTRIDAKKDWAIFEAGSGAQKVCWIVSQPTGTKATKGGKEVSVNRGDIFLMVSVRPGDKVKNEVSFLAGYPFKGGSKVKISVGSKNFELFTDGENAWTTSGDSDNRLTAAFRAGADAQVEGLSSRGTTTRDTFSLSGFTAALKAAQDRCN